jgi:uncharacterized protein (TIGR03084 family)
LARRHPSFTSPTTQSEGMRTSSKKTWLKEWAPVMSMMGAVVSPGASMGQMKYEIPLRFGASGSVRASSIPHLARWPPLVQILEPLTTHSSASRTALVVREARTVPPLPALPGNGAVGTLLVSESEVKFDSGGERVPTVSDLLRDLAAEQAALDVLLSGLAEESWLTPTPAAGWDVRDSVGHLCFFEENATVAVSDPPAFEIRKQELIASKAGGEAPDVAIARHGVSPADLLARWRTARCGYRDAAAEAEATSAAAGQSPPRVPWYGPSMSLASLTTARIMEAWAHGQDIRDAVGAPPEVGARLRHVIHLGVAARPYSFAAHGATDPGDPVVVTAEAPDGREWVWGPDDPTIQNRVAGPALDLALVFTQRRHLSHTAVAVTGPVARRWLDIAQAFAGPGTTTAVDR